MSKAGRAGLTIWDRLILLVAWVVTCGLVYLLGFYVGKGTQEQRFGMEERIVRLPVTSIPPPEGQRPKSANDLTFYETLVSGGRAGETPPARSSTTLATPVLPPPQPPPVAVASPALRPAVPPPTLAPSAVVPPPTIAPAVRQPTPPPAATARAEPPVAVATTLPRVATAPPPPAKPTTVGGWTVEVNPTRNRSEAEVLYKLKGHGYDVKIVQVQRDGDTWFRLRVGRYATPELASETVRRLRDQEGVAHVFVASE